MKMQWYLAVLVTYIMTTYAQNTSLRIKVSENKRFLINENGKPFFYLADTGWELFHRLDRRQAETYLKTRASQGFTAIQAVILAEENGLKTPNPYGHVPFLDFNSLEINERYFMHVDFIIDLAAKLGILMAVLPTWGDKIDKLQWGQGPVIFTPDKAFKYGEFLGNRYKHRTNILWVLGGDRAPEPAHLDIYRALAKGIIKGVGDSTKTLFTFHPPGGRTSSEWFHNDSWLSFNMLQTGHCRDADVYDRIAHDYNLKPTKPTMDGEPIYEDHPVCFDARNHGYSNDYDVRKSAYWGVFSGGHGHTYGCHSVWQMFDYMHIPVNNPRQPWYNALDLPGAVQMKHLKHLMLSRPYLSRVPDQNIIIGENPKGPDFKVSTRSIDNSYLMVYMPVGGNVEINPQLLTAKSYLAYWFNPRDGSVIHAGKWNKKNIRVFSAPENGMGKDWVLVLDDSDAGFGIPGSSVFDK